MFLIMTVVLESSPLAMAAKSIVKVFLTCLPFLSSSKLFFFLRTNLGSSFCSSSVLEELAEESVSTVPMGCSLSEWPLLLECSEFLAYSVLRTSEKGFTLSCFCWLCWYEKN